MRWITRTTVWFEQRLKLKAIWDATGGHLVPPDAKWWYVFGSGTLMFFMIQIITGICLAFVYVPSADQAYASLEYLNYEQPLGWLLRAIHAWSANGMVLMMLLHMTHNNRNVFYNYPATS